MPSIITGYPVIIPFIKLVIRDFPFLINEGAADCIKVVIIEGNPTNIFPIIGIKLPNKNVDTVEAKPFNAGFMSCPKDNLPNTFCADAFIAAKDPVKVVAASLAVVPVISNLFWITWIAEYTSARLLMLYFTPVIFLASASKRSISVFVPP